MIVGDGPTEPTGLGRIARDLVSQIRVSNLPVDVVQIGGTCPPPWTQWPCYPMDRNGDWGAACVERYWQDLFGSKPGVLWIIWDPGRLYDYCAINLPVQRWTYTAIDGANRKGEISGPARAALTQFDRVLAYGRYGAERLKASGLGSISYLPHGLVTSLYRDPAVDDWEAQGDQEVAWVSSILGPHIGTRQVIGCVATNQPRKDLSLFFGTLRELLDRGHRVYGWLHTDELVKAWAVPQLIEDFSLQKKVTVTLDQTYTDRQLAVLYQRCDLTLAPGLGEGFGYPIVESLAAGVPVIHGDSGGGAELLPKTEWRVPRQATRLDGIYAVERPVYQIEDWANAAERALAWRRQVGPDVARAYCQGTVAHLDWSALWPRWEQWIRQGLEG